MNREQLLLELGRLLFARGEQQLLEYIRVTVRHTIGQQICDVETQGRIVWLIGLPD